MDVIGQHYGPTTAPVMWLNERTEDFALYGELEKAFFKNHRKLDVSCIVERDLYGNHLEANANVGEAVPKFKAGTLAAVAGTRVRLSVLRGVFHFRCPSPSPPLLYFSCLHFCRHAVTCVRGPLEMYILRSIIRFIYTPELVGRCARVSLFSGTQNTCVRGSLLGLELVYFQDICTLRSFCLDVPCRTHKKRRVLELCFRHQIHLFFV